FYACSGDDLIPEKCSGSLCFDQASCGCVDTGRSTTTPLTCPPGCNFIDDPNDSCKSYFLCSGDDLIPVNCSDTLCFDQELCGCVDKGVTTTKSPTTKVTEPITGTIPTITCPPGCPFADDPNDNCGRFYICDGGDVISAKCPGILCFDQETCQCV
ncbi:hypothetical protein Avbf_05928, partial [Armadillidium vulgare]